MIDAALVFPPQRAGDPVVSGDDAGRPRGARGGRVVLGETSPAPRYETGLGSGLLSSCTS